MLVPEFSPQYVMLTGRPPAGLIPGHSFAAMIQGTPEEPVLMAGGFRIPIALSTGLLPGQPVRVEVVQQESGLQLRLTPQPVSVDPVPAAAPSALGGSLGQALAALNMFGRPEVAAPLIPAGLPASADAFQALLTVLFTGGTLGKDLQFLGSVLTGGGAASLFPQEAVAVLTAWISAQHAAASGDFLALMRQAGAGKPAEARLAAALQLGEMASAIESLRNDLQSILMALRGNGAVRAFLQARGALKSFDDAVQRVLDRLSGTQLQNLRALESAYFFLELPMPPESEFARAQVHFFGEGGPGKEGIDSRNATVVLDLSVSRLGDLWIALRVQEGRCQCEIRAALPEAVAALESASGELAEALAGAGYPGAGVRVGAWETNRIEELAALMRRYTGIDLNA